MAISLDDFGFNIGNVGGILSKLFTFIFIIIVIIVVAGIVFFIMKRRKDKLSPANKKIGWWEEIQGKLIPTSMDNAKEIIIPGTRLRVFYIKSKDMWLPRFTRGLTKDLFYIAITPKREMVNFTLTSISEDMSKAGLEYDHTDMLWASENLREFIKRNYRDKSTPWWKEFQGAITTAIYIILLTFSFVVILFFMRQMMQEIGGLLGGISNLLDRIESIEGKGSGIAPALLPFIMFKLKGKIE